MAHQAVDVGLGVACSRLDAATCVTGPAHRPIPLDVDAVAVYRVGQLALLDGGLVDHVRRFTLPLVVGGVPDFIVMGARRAIVVATEAGIGIISPGEGGVVSDRALLIGSTAALVYAVTADLGGVWEDKIIFVITVNEPAIAPFCCIEARQMSVDMKSLIACYRNGLTFNIAKAVFENNTKRYDRLVAKLHEPDRAGFVRFNAFAIDYNRYRRNQLAAATGKARGHEK